MAQKHQGRPRAFEEAEVFAVSDELLKQNTRPSREKVARVLGRGSSDALERCVKKWWRVLPTRLIAWHLLVELLHELSLCRITHLEPLRQQRVDKLLADLQGMLGEDPDRKPKNT